MFFLPSNWRKCSWGIWMWKRSKGPDQSGSLTFHVFCRFFPLKFVKFDVLRVWDVWRVSPHCEWKQWCLHRKKLMKPGRNLHITDKYQSCSSSLAFHSISLALPRCLVERRLVMKDTELIKNVLDFFLPHLFHMYNAQLSCYEPAFVQHICEFYECCLCLYTDAATYTPSTRWHHLPHPDIKQ